MNERKCICPVVEIMVTKDEHVSRAQMSEIADCLNASVALIGDGGRSVIYGKHREDCPCGPVRNVGRS